MELGERRRSRPARRIDRERIQQLELVQAAAQSERARLRLRGQRQLRQRAHQRCAPAPGVGIELAACLEGRRREVPGREVHEATDRRQRRARGAWKLCAERARERVQGIARREPQAFLAPPGETGVHDFVRGAARS